MTARQPSVVDEHVERVEVAVQPDGRIRCRPGRHRLQEQVRAPVAVHPVPEGGETGGEALRPLGERHTPERVPGGVTGRRAVQRGEEAAEPDRGGVEVLGRGELPRPPRQPRHDGPRPRVAPPRCSHPHRHRTGTGSSGPSTGSHRCSLAIGSAAAARPRQPHGEPVAQPEGHVVPSVGHQVERLAGEVGVLVGEQDGDQAGVDPCSAAGIRAMAECRAPCRRRSQALTRVPSRARVERSAYDPPGGARGTGRI